MKRLLLSAVALVMAMGMSAQRWDFTNWSAETVANLKAANALGTEWSDIEKAGGTTADIAKENCFWEVKAHGSAEGAPLTIGGTPVKELEGLLFLHTNDRSLAIAVNYGDCTSLNGSGFGPYNGPQYLWFGGKNLNYIVIPNVRPGTEIKIGEKADLTVYDLEENYNIDPSTFVSMGKATPFEGNNVYGRCKMTICGGCEVFNDLG